MQTYGETLYNLKRRFLIIGLTGYTGSGCTTAARILTKSQKSDLPGHNFLSNVADRRRHEKLKKIWQDLPWFKFVNIEVSRVIFLFVLHMAASTEPSDTPYKEAKELAKQNSDSIEGISLLLDKNQNFSDPDIAKKIVNAYEVFRLLYVQWKNMCQYDLSSFIERMQDFGDQIRKYGKVFPNDDSELNPEHIFILPSILRRLIKSYIVANGSKFFVIDAFRNPYEVEYFKRRYSEFYLIAIQRSIRDRQEALKDYDSEALYRLEEREQGKLVKEKLKENISDWVTSQNIPECAQKADYLIHNYSDNSKTWPYLRYHLIRLIALSQYPGGIPPNSDERSMQLAMTAKQNSGCMSRHVGAIVTNREGYLLGVGWNDPPSGQIPCSLRTAKELIENLDKIAFSEYERSGQFIQHITDQNLGDKPYCFCDQLSLIEGKKSREFTRAMHAEENALIQAMVHGAETIKEGTLYTTDSPCTLCAKKAYHLGIKRIVYIEEYPGISLEHSIRVGDRSIQIDQFEGATGSSYSKIFVPLMPEKDYLKIYM